MSGALRVAAIGCGQVLTNQHLPGFRAAGSDLVDLTVFSSRTRASAERARDLWGRGRVAESVDEVLGGPDVDAVDIATPPDLHAELTVRAAEAGKHVLVEKPMALSVAESDAMRDAARANGVVLETAEQHRYMGTVMTAAGLLRAGAVGQVTGVEAYLAHGGPQDWAPGAHWFFERVHAGGGALMDLGVHAVDAVRAVTGEEVAEVAALVGDVRDGIEREGDVLFRLRSGTPGHLRVSWGAPYGEERRLIVWGTRGQLLVDPEGVSIREAGGVVRAVRPEPTRNLYGAFARACRGAGPKPSGFDGRQALAVVQACYDASRTRSWVSTA